MKKMRESLSGRQSPIRSTLRGLRLHKQQRKGFLGKSYHLWILEELSGSRSTIPASDTISQEDYPSYTKAFDIGEIIEYTTKVFFPEGSLSQHIDRHIVRARWYSTDLMTMGEGSIFELRDNDELEVYRFTPSSKLR